MLTQSEVRTAFADSYLIKLCRHFARKVPATRIGQQALIEFSFGRCHMRAEADLLRLRVELNLATQASYAEQMLSIHLARIARDEQLELRWHRQGS